MIFFDKDISTPLHIVGGKEIKGLKDKTGADILISKTKAPPINEKIINAHIDSKAEFISIIRNNREPEQIRVNEFWLAHRILFVPLNRTDIINATQKMVNMGSVYDMIIYEDAREISSYIMLENSLVTNLHNNIGWIKTISTLPISWDDIKTIINVMENNDNKFLTALVWLTDTNREENKTGKGKIVCNTIRKYLGIPDGWNITLKPEGEE